MSALRRKFYCSSCNFTRYPGECSHPSRTAAATTKWFVIDVGGKTARAPRAAELNKLTMTEKDLRTVRGWPYRLNRHGRPPGPMVKEGNDIVNADLWRALNGELWRRIVDFNGEEHWTLVP
jgi:hypothetical protein